MTVFHSVGFALEDYDALRILYEIGTDFEAWLQALRQALDAVRRYGADALVIALRVDTFEGDPISRFRLRSADYLRVGEALARAGLPTVFVMEGGYAVAALGTNVVNALEGFCA